MQRSSPVRVYTYFCISIRTYIDYYLHSVHSASICLWKLLFLWGFPRRCTLCKNSLVKGLGMGLYKWQVPVIWAETFNAKWLSQDNFNRNLSRNVGCFKRNNNPPAFWSGKLQDFTEDPMFKEIAFGIQNLTKHYPWNDDRIVWLGRDL